MTEWKMTHPIVYPTVDCAIFRDSTMKKMYLARKAGQLKWRFVGGFVDPSDSSFQDAALREAREETGLDCSILDWVTSQKVCDPRYEGKPDKIITSLFAVVVDDGVARPMDDISELFLFDVSSIDASAMVPEHQELFRKLKIWLERRDAKNSLGGV